ncbi:protein of unknown function [Pararobbsia alpina]|jgi:hypothetical protein
MHIETDMDARERASVKAGRDARVFLPNGLFGEFPDQFRQFLTVRARTYGASCVAYAHSKAENSIARECLTGAWNGKRCQHSVAGTYDAKRG